MEQSKDVVISTPMDTNEIEQVIFNGIPYRVKGKHVSRIVLVIDATNIPKLTFEYEAQPIGK